MIIATASRSGTITAVGEMLVSGAKLKISLHSVSASSIGGLSIKTSETSLRGPPGLPGAGSLPTDPLAYYILAKG
jgi:hypothetical protein